MKKTFLILMVLAFCSTVSAQFVAILEIEKPVKGVCDKDKVYALFSILEDQVEAVCPISKEEILARLNKEVTFLKENPTLKYKGMVGIIINCKGEMVKCDTENTDKTKMDEQIIAVFKSLGQWKAGKLNGKEVDSSVLYSIRVKKGLFTFD